MSSKELQDLIFLIAIIFFIYLLVKRKGIALGSAYTNEESWEIVRDRQGRLSKIVVHRNAIEK